MHPATTAEGRERPAPTLVAALVGRGRYLLLVTGDAKGAVALLEKAFKLSPLVEKGWLLGNAREAK